MGYPRKPKGFKTAWCIEAERRIAITKAYQTLYKELYEENKKLVKTITQLQEGRFNLERRCRDLELEKLDTEKS